MNRAKAMTAASWSLQVLAAGILAQTLFFKFTGAEESVYIFETLGVEPWGRYAAGVSELVAAAMLLTPRLVVFGAMMTLGVLTGALGAHVAKLGIEVRGDGGLLFGLALTAFVAAAAVLWIRRGAIPVVGMRLVPGVCPFRPGEVGKGACHA